MIKAELNKEKAKRYKDRENLLKGYTILGSMSVYIPEWTFDDVYIVAFDFRESH